MNTATVTLKHKKKGTTINVDQSDYATDLGKYKYRDYSLVNESHNEAEEKPTELTRTDETINESGDNTDPSVDVDVDAYAQVEALNTLPIDINDDDDVKLPKKTSRRKK